MADGYATRFNDNAANPTANGGVAYSAKMERRLDGVGWVQASTGLTRSGKRPGTGLEVTVLSSPERAQVAPGRAIVEHSTLGPHRYVLEAATAKNLAARPSSGTSRIDLVVVQVFNAEDGTTSLKEPQIVVIGGDAAASPVAPLGKVPDGSLLLGTLTVPATGAIAVNSSVRRTVTSGGIPPLIDLNDRDSVQPYNGLKTYRDDLNVFQSYRAGAWETDLRAADIAFPHFRGDLVGFGNNAISSAADVGFTMREDTDSGWSAGVYTVKRAGVYRVACRFRSNSVGTGANAIILRRNGAVNDYLTGTQPGGQSLAGFGGSTELRCALNDTLSIRTLANFTVQDDSPAVSSQLTIDYVRA